MAQDPNNLIQVSQDFHNLIASTQQIVESSKSSKNYQFISSFLDKLFNLLMVFIFSALVIILVLWNDTTFTNNSKMEQKQYQPKSMLYQLKKNPKKVYKFLELRGEDILNQLDIQIQDQSSNYFDTLSNIKSPQISQRLKQADSWLNQNSKQDTKNQKYSLKINSKINQILQSIQIQQIKEFLGLTESSEQRKKQRQQKNNHFSNIDQKYHRSIRALQLNKRQKVLEYFFKKNGQENTMILKLLQSNYNLGHPVNKFESQYKLSVQKQFSFNGEQQLPICLLLNTHNNAFNNQITRTLNSIYNQKYNNYQVIISDSFSNDKTVELIIKYLSQYSQMSSKTVLIQHKITSPSFSFYTSSKKCQQNSIVILLDANSQIIGNQAFKIINHNFHQKNPNVMYSSQYRLDVSKLKVKFQKAIDYDISEKFMPLYRNIPAKYGKMLIVKNEILSKLSEDYIRQNKKYFEYSGFDSIAVSLLQLSCGNIITIKRPLTLAIYDSQIQWIQRQFRSKQLKQIISKVNLDIC